MKKADNLRNVDSASFGESVLDGGGTIVVEFMAYGCEHSRALEPMLQDVAAISRSTFFRVDVETDRELSDRYDVSVTPTFVMFSGGNVVGRVEGPRPGRTLYGLLMEPFKA